MLQRQTLAFRELLEAVWKNSGFYREYYSGHGIREQDIPDLAVEQLPFVSKRLLMDNFDRVVTDPRLKINDLERWLDGVRDPRQLFQNEFIVMHSSGSSGITGIFAYSRTDWQTMNGIMAGRLPQPENQDRGRTRVAFYRATHGHFAGVATAVQLPAAVYETLIVSLLEPIERVVGQLQRFQPHRLTGYASSIAVLADQAIERNLRIQPQRVFVSGDMLTTEMEQRIIDAWKAPISNLYGASESLFLAIKDSNDGVMRVMSDLNVLEILDENNQPVKPGEEGRVVITNLCNHTVPILRYELGDYVTRGSSADSEAIQAIRPGKANDALPIVLDSGKPDNVSPRALTSFYALGVERAQFVCRNPNHIRIDYIAESDVNDCVRNEFQRILELKGAAGMPFEVRRVASIAADQKTGKVRLVVLQDDPPQRPLNIADRPREQTTKPRGFSSQGFEEFKKADIAQSIANRFEQQVEKYHDRLAVKCAAASLTYDEVNRQANRIAHAILASVGQGLEPVVFLLEQGIPAIAAILGILKAGRFYLSLDPSYSADWLATILKHALSPLILTNNVNLRAAINLGFEADAIINLDELNANLPDSNPGLSVSPDSFAYVYYTSGSTGQPKGVAQTHRHALHQVMTYTNGLELRAADRCTLLHSHNFSASRLDIFAPLLNGGAVLPFSVATEGVHPLSRWLREEEITIFHWVPSAFRHFCATETKGERFSSIRMLVLGSEPVTAREVELCQKHFSSDCTLVNRFGTTETGNICLYFMDPSMQFGAEVVPVGFPLEDVEVLLLDETGDQVAYGQVGEITIRSPYLSGYWREPEPERARFAADATAPGKRRYRSGDTGYMLPDGCLVHLGRNDLQVKIRGHRVELGRVEWGLIGHPEVCEAAVITHGEPPDDTRLLAYFVGENGARPASSALRAFLETRLPAYMVPAIFIRLDALPMTAAGKLDRRSLPRPSFEQLAVHDSYVEPRTALERKLATVWSEILEVPRVSIHDKFLDLGGHSLLAGRIISRIGEICEFEISFREFFDHPTVALLAELMSPNRLQIGDTGLAGLLDEIEPVSDEETSNALKKDGR
jgi:amino acid adenylation domain-containing protein